MSHQNDQLKIELLKEELQLLSQSITTLKISVDKCRHLLGKDEYTFEEMESFDSLTSKFSRTSDFFTQKILRTIWMLLHEPFVPFIDLLNKAEKMGMIRSADTLLVIRDIRNQIAHEYLPDAIPALIKEVLDISSELFANIEQTREFVTKRGW